MNICRLNLIIAFLLNIYIYQSRGLNIFRNEKNIIPQKFVNTKGNIGSNKTSNLKDSKLISNKIIKEDKATENFITIRLNKQDIPSKFLSTYYGEITIGSESENKMNVLFDTGSSEFWIPYETCNTSQCLKKNKYKKTNSFKYKYDNRGIPSMLEIDYLSGKIQGFDGYDTVKLGSNLEIPNTNISFATNVDISILDDFKWDGIVGLGFENESSRKRGIKPFLDHLVETKALTNKNLKNMFGYYLSDMGGMITFGGINNYLKRSHEEDFIWTPVTIDQGYWSIDILGVRKEKLSDISGENSEKSENDLIVKYEGFHDGGKNSIIDTGTFLIYAPKNTMNNYLKDLVVNSCEDKNTLPYLIFQIKADPIHSSIKGLYVMELVLSPADYVIEYWNKETLKKECILGIKEDDQTDQDHIDGWTLGQIFLKSFYTIFDKDNLRIGFVRSKQHLSNSHNNQNIHNKSFINLRSSNKNGPL